MTCDDARQLLLTADLAELTPGGPMPLGAHLAGCADCRALAGRVLAAARVVQAERDRPPRRAAGALAEEARRAARARRRARRRWTAVPALAAAAVVVVLLVRDGTPPIPIPPRTVETTPLVDAPPGRHVAVFETGNPAIVVVWTF
ncbi:MAG: hypothetical protein OER21_04510 [Gemmatimonadota bacterium]|nr:hypothetical protein [Gemmatimonadota bacterium]